MKQERATGLAERQVTQLIKDDQIDMDQSIRHLPRATVGFLQFQRIDQLNGGVVNWGQTPFMKS